MSDVVSLIISLCCLPYSNKLNKTAYGICFVWVAAKLPNGKNCAHSDNIHTHTRTQAIVIYHEVNSKLIHTYVHTIIQVVNKP